MKQLIVMAVLAVGLQQATYTSGQAGSSTAPTAQSDPAAPTLAVGDPCPLLKVEKFLKGDPVSVFEKGTVYVVEFWATWCGPCIEGIPHLSALQAQYRDRGVKIVGINIRELRRTPEGLYRHTFDEQARIDVESFVREEGDRMAYTVAYDGAAKSMDEGWMQASGSGGIPNAFIVDRTGKIAWIGHPMVLRMPLGEVAEGNWDLKTGPERVKKAEDAYIGAMKLFASDGKAGLDAWDQAAKDYPMLADDLNLPKFDALISAGLCAAASATGEVLWAEAIQIHDTRQLNRIAWSIVNPATDLATRDLDLALRAARSAHEFTQGKDAGVLDTLARVHFCRGEIDKAIDLQSRAVELADEQLKLRLTPALDEYQKAKQ